MFPQLRLEFDPWPRNFDMPQVLLKKKETKKKKKKKKKTVTPKKWKTKDVDHQALEPGHQGHPLGSSSKSQGARQEHKLLFRRYHPPGVRQQEDDMIPTCFCLRRGFL